MLIPPGKLKYGEPEKRAVWPILGAIEEGLDVDGLSPAYRAILADLYDEVGLIVGVKTLTTAKIPSDWVTDAAARDAACRAERSRGIDGVRRLSLYHQITQTLIDADLCTVPEIERADEDGRLRDVLGPRPLQEVRAAVRWHRARREYVQSVVADITPHELAFGPGGIGELESFGVSSRTMMKLYALGIVLVADVARLDAADQLQSVPGLGPKTVKQLRAAIRTLADKIPPVGQPDVQES